MKNMRSRQTDQELVLACQRGDRGAFQCLFEVYKDTVYSIAYHFSGNADLAGDISQQVFMKMFIKLGGFRADSDLRTWVYRIAANACTDEYRMRRRFTPLEDDGNRPVLSRRESQEDDYYRRQLSTEVRGAVAKLKPKFRIPIVLKYVEGLSYEEIAEVLGCSMGTVASRLNRGHKALGQMLAHLNRGPGSRKPGPGSPDPTNSDSMSPGPTSSGPRSKDVR